MKPNRTKYADYTEENMFIYIFVTYTYCDSLLNFVAAKLCYLSSVCEERIVDFLFLHKEKCFCVAFCVHLKLTQLYAMPVFKTP